MGDDDDEHDATTAAAAASPKRHNNTAYLSEIEAGIWIGNASAASDMERLRQHRITHVLTLDSCPLPTHILQQPDIVNKYVQVSDVAKEDLLTHFDECTRFIGEALAQQHRRVLVHCYFGTSRSVTIVIAFLMRSHRITFTPAFDRVKAKCPAAAPNASFVQQLRLFHRMGWKIDPQHAAFKMYRLRQAGEKMRKAKILPQCCVDLVRPDPALQQAKPEPHVYRCRRCRRVVAAKSNIITHQRATPPAAVICHIEEEVVPKTSPAKHVDLHPHTAPADQLHLQQLSLSDHSSPESSSAAEHRRAGASPQKTAPPKPTGEADAETALQQPCRDIIFVEPIAWMDGVLREPQGSLLCPKCQTKLGSFSWTMGCRCPSCGQLQSPAFYLWPGRVELGRSVQNVEMSL